MVTYLRETGKVKRPPMRVKTAFEYEKSSNNDIQLPGQEDVLESDIQIHRKIVAATERLANDKSANRSVRKKRRKDYKAAAFKLDGLMKGLDDLRTSSSKPDISDFDTISQGTRSRAGSGFSLNNMKYWPKFTTKFGVKSCPTTPRGSVPDLSIGDAEDLSAGKAVTMRRGPAERTAHKISVQNWNQECRRASSSALPPTVPHRKITSSSIGSCHTDGEILRLPSTSSVFENNYTNIGYKSSVPYHSSYRQSQFPTLQEKVYPSRSRSIASYNGEVQGKNSTKFSISKKNDSVTTIESIDNDLGFRLVNDFSTSSLDRKMLRTRPAKSTTIDPQRDSVSSGVSSASSTTSPSVMSRTTTFPVSNNFSFHNVRCNSDSNNITMHSSRIQPMPQKVDKVLSSINNRPVIKNQNLLITSPSKHSTNATMV